MENQPPEIIRHIASFVGSPSDLSFPQTCKMVKRACDTDETLQKKRKIVTCDDSPFVKLCHAIEGGHLDLAFFIANSYERYEFGPCAWNPGMCAASKAGYRELVELLVKKGADDWNSALVAAAKAGHRELVELFIEKGEFGIAFYWHKGMFVATRAGHRGIVEFFIEKFGRSLNIDDWDTGAYQATIGGHRDLVEFFIKKGANNWNNGMRAAAMYAHRELVDFFIEKGANDWDGGFVSAADGGHRDLIIFFIKKGARISFDAMKTQKDLVELLRMTQNYDWGEAMKFAIDKGDVKLIEFLVSVFGGKKTK